MANDNKGFGSMDPQKQKNTASQGGQSQGQQNNPANFANDSQKASQAGEKGGTAAHQSGHAHELTEEERSRGGSNSGGNFANDPQRASDAGRKGGSR